MKENIFKLNKIYNEDCIEGIKKISDNSVDLVVIDPPYDITTSNKNKNKNSLSKRINSIEKELIDSNLVNGYDYSVLDELVRVMKKVNIYIWCNAKQIPIYLKKFVDELGCKFDVLVWYKTNPLPLYNNKYLNDKEYCLYFRKNGYCNPRNYEDAKTIYISGTNAKDKKLYSHPTIKPLEVIRKLIRNSSLEYDLVLDCFIGSGTTAVAAVKENRQFLGYEINKEYYDIANKRINEAIEEKNKEA